MNMYEGQSKPTKHYRVTTVQIGVLSQTIATEAEIPKLKEGMDFFVNLANGEAIINPPFGEIIKYEDGIPGWGFEAWELTKASILASGDYVKLSSDNPSAGMVRTLRAACGDTFELQHFFRTRRNPSYGIKINTKRCWRVVESLEHAPSSAESEE